MIFLCILGDAPSLESGVLKIYSSCETGLAPGRSVKVGFHIFVVVLHVVLFLLAKFISPPKNTNAVQ